MLEVDAYASVITAFRASGYLDWTRENLLLSMREELGISGDRHALEVRRVEADGNIQQIAESLAGVGRTTRREAPRRYLDNELDDLDPYAQSYQYEPQNKRPQSRSRRSPIQKPRSSRSTKSMKNGAYQMLLKKKKELVKELVTLEKEREQDELMNRREELLKQLEEERGGSLSPEELSLREQLKDLEKNISEAVSSTSEVEKKIKESEEDLEKILEMKVDTVDKEKEGGPVEMETTTTETETEKKKSEEEKIAEIKVREEKKKELEGNLSDLKAKASELSEKLDAMQKNKEVLVLKFEEAKKEREREEEEKKKKEEEEREKELAERREKEAEEDKTETVVPSEVEAEVVSEEKDDKPMDGIESESSTSLPEVEGTSEQEEPRSTDEKQVEITGEGKEAAGEVTEQVNMEIDM